MFKQNPSILIFFRVKVDAPLSLTDVKFLLNLRREAKFYERLFYEPWSRYIANQSGSAKETVSLKTGKNVEMLDYFICMGTQGRTLIDINDHYEITMNEYKNWT